MLYALWIWQGWPPHREEEGQPGKTAKNAGSLVPSVQSFATHLFHLTSSSPRAPLCTRLSGAACVCVRVFVYSCRGRNTTAPLGIDVSLKACQDMKEQEQLYRNVGVGGEVWRGVERGCQYTPFLLLIVAVNLHTFRHGGAKIEKYKRSLQSGDKLFFIVYCNHCNHTLCMPFCHFGVYAGPNSDVGLI